MNKKTEDVSDVQEDADPVRITIQEIKTEPEVSCMFLSVHMKQLHCLLTRLSRPSSEMLVDSYSLLNVDCDVPLPFLFKQL
jgi:hypothetical protein